MQPQNLLQWIILLIVILIVGSVVACFRGNSQSPPQPTQYEKPHSFSQKVSKPKKTKAPKTKIKIKPEEDSTVTAKLALNSATIDELTLLPSISKKAAQKIVSWRKNHGAFFNFQEVESIPGLSKTVLKSLKKYTSCSY